MLLFKKKKTNVKTNTDIVGENLNFATRESYNLLRTNVNFALVAKKKGNVIGITSSCPQEGKSYTSINLAYTFAKDDKKVLLIEGDMRRGSLATDLSVKAETGLSELLLDDSKDVIVKEVLHKNLSVIFAGSAPPNPSELLGSESMRKLLEKFSNEYDVVIVDLPPVLSVSDTMTISRFLSGIVVIVRHSLTKRKDLIETVRALRFAKVEILGFVYNDFSNRLGSYGKKRYKRYYEQKNNYHSDEEEKINEVTTKDSSHK